ncbi:MAG: hypothetical protein ACI9O4_001806 [Chitinophagales bacterium]|jgi:hypothetical protein
MKKILFCVLIGLSAQLFAQTEVVQLSVHLKNDDILTGTSELRTLNFKTDFGTLNFPIDEINSIEIGLKDSRFDKGNLLNLLDKVENGESNDKENAFDQVIQMDEGAIPFIKAYLSSSKGFTENNDNENDISVQTLYEVMLAKYKVTRNYSLNDIISYKNEFRVEGIYDFTEVALNTDYGRIKIARNDIARIDVKIVSEGMNNKNTFKLFANQNISGNKEEGWLNTGVLVKKGEKLSINSSGQIILASLSGNTYAADGGVNGSVGVEGNKPTYGQVVFKVSQSGFENKAGDNYTAYAAQTGIVYIAIYESVFNSANSGYYTVNLKVN